MNRKTLKQSITSLTPGDFGTLKDILVDMLDYLPTDVEAPEEPKEEAPDGD